MTKIMYICVHPTMSYKTSLTCHMYIRDVHMLHVIPSRTYQSWSCLPSLGSAWPYASHDMWSTHHTSHITHRTSTSYINITHHISRDSIHVYGMCACLFCINHDACWWWVWTRSCLIEHHCCYVMSCDVMWCHVMPCDAMPCSYPVLTRCFTSFGVGCVCLNSPVILIVYQSDDHVILVTDNLVDDPTDTTHTHREGTDQRTRKCGNVCVVICCCCVCVCLVCLCVYRVCVYRVSCRYPCTFHVVWMCVCEYCAPKIQLPTKTTHQPTSWHKFPHHMHNNTLASAAHCQSCVFKCQVIQSCNCNCNTTTVTCMRISTHQKCM